MITKLEVKDLQRKGFYGKIDPILKYYSDIIIPVV